MNLMQGKKTPNPVETGDLSVVDLQCSATVRQFSLSK